MMWFNLGWLVAAALATIALLSAVLIRLVPHSIMRAVGIECTSLSGCVSPFPGWLQWGLWALTAILLAGFFVRGSYIALSTTLAMTKLRRAVLAVGRPAADDSRVSSLSIEPLVLLDSSDTLAFTVGLRRPVIVLSTTLVSSLDSREIETIVAHETAHARGRDNLILLAARALEHVLFFLPGAGLVYSRLRRSIELAADAHAHQKVGDGVLVASTLHRFASLVSNRSAGRLRVADSVSAQFSEEGLVTERIVQLLQEPRGTYSPLRIRLACLAFAAILLAFSSGAYLLANVSPSLGSHASACSVGSQSQGSWSAAFLAKQ
jgi:Zn-dependent protease with chaperone function